ncbi:MAG: hypothetical protein NUW01_13010 [Gemmatimonadaceae bacterium]|nr:hypothetical protein [Gemmatimonadaceae bacterium]
MGRLTKTQVERDLGVVDTRGRDGRKRENIRTLLDHWDDFFSTARAMTSNGDSGGILLLPSASRHPSVLELGRCLGLLRQHGPTQFGHFVGYWGAQTRIVRIQKTSRKGKRTVTLRNPDGTPATQDFRERLVPRWVRLQKVRLAESFVVGAFVGEVFLPDVINPYRRDERRAA